MKERLRDRLQYYMVLTLAFLPVPVLNRVSEVIRLTSSYTLPYSSWTSILQGTGIDLLFFFAFASVLLLPYLGLSYISKKASSVFYVFFLVLVSLTGFLLSSYFTVTLIPLDQVIFFYTVDEIVHIVMSSAKFDLIGLLTFLLLVFIPFFLFRIMRNVKFSTTFLIILTGLLPVSIFSFSLINIERKAFAREFDFFLARNKLQYGIRAIDNHIRNSSIQRSSSFYDTGEITGTGLGEDLKILSKKFQRKNKGFIYLNPNYPFLRLDNTPDVLGRFFNLKKEKPNIVFVIVESLTPVFCGLDPYYGSFMPFLDSLINKSLYWENIMATSERTFGVLPAIFGSLPFTNLWNNRGGYTPDHFSLIRYLKENGYYSNFFYGSDPAFSNYDWFLKREGVDFLLNSFGEEYQKHKITSKRNTWGFPDGDLFKRSFEILDSFPHSPRLDIYMTLSMHFPFTVPKQEYLKEKVSERINELGLKEKTRIEIVKSEEIFSSILYTDETLRFFFTEHRKRPGFDNTIFIITGDHAMPELKSSLETPSEKYHVPLIIYSSLLKGPGQFRAISSHLDITPTILSLLKLPYNLKIKPYCHWLGSALDVAQQTKYPRSVAFFRNNRTSPDYFRDPYFLSFNYLTKMDKDQHLVPYHDSLLLMEMEQENELFQILSNYAIENNALIPGSKFFNDELEEDLMTPAKIITFDNYQTSNEFIRILHPIKFRKNFEYVQFDIAIKLNIHQTDSVKSPPMIMEVVDSSQTSHLYSEFRLENGTTKLRGDTGWRSVRITKKVDLGFISNRNDKWMKLYLWNSNHSLIILDSLTINLTGFYTPVMIHSDTSLLYSFDSTGYKFEKEPKDFLNFITPYQIDSNYLILKCRLKFKYSIADARDTARWPRLIISVEDTSRNMHVYHQLPFPASDSASIPMKWYSYQMNKYLDVSSVTNLPGSIFKIYFFNNRHCSIRYDSLNLEIFGIN